MANVLVIAEQSGGHLRKATLNAVSAGRALAQRTGGQLHLALLGKGVAPARKLARARILLLADEGKTDEEIAAALHVHRVTVERIRRRFYGATIWMKWRRQSGWRFGVAAG